MRKLLPGAERGLVRDASVGDQVALVRTLPRYVDYPRRDPDLGNSCRLAAGSASLAVMDVRLLGGFAATAPAPTLGRARRLAIAASTASCLVEGVKNRGGSPLMAGRVPESAGGST
jgi:hypothetical protein